jgi:ankyrin repeat protein
MTPLTTVILEGHNEAVRYLVEHGADINLKGHDERSPAFYAVEYNNHFALEFLYERGACFTGASIAHPSIAHVAAHHADIETLRILTTFRLTLRDVDCVDNEGLAIPQIVDKRLQWSSNNDGDFAQAFRIFLESVRTEGSAPPSPDLEEDDEFHDAIEQPSA